MKELIRHHRAELAAGHVAYQHCAACGRDQAFARPFCAACGATGPEWQRARGTGRIAAVTTVHRAPTPEWKAKVPYAIALVDLDEGLRVMGHAPPDAAVGDRVTAQSRTLADRPLLVFTSTETAGQ